MSWFQDDNFRKTLLNFANSVVGSPFQNYLKSRGITIPDDPEFENDLSILMDLDNCYTARLQDIQCINYIDINRNIGGKSFLSCVAFVSGIKAAKELLEYEELTNIFGTHPSPIDLISLQNLFTDTGDDERLRLVEERILQQPKENFLYYFPQLMFRARESRQMIRFYMMHDYSITTSSQPCLDTYFTREKYADIKHLISQNFTVVKSNIRDQYYDEILKINLND